jgi:hypothetical protein
MQKVKAIVTLQDSKPDPGKVYIDELNSEVTRSFTALALTIAMRSEGWILMSLVSNH